VADNQAMGALGAAHLGPAAQVITHCNAGALATAGYGTALGVIRSAWREKRLRRVFATETRPWLQGARLTAWELHEDGIPVTLIADSAAAQLMRSGAISWVITGADRIAANGDVANKIGTYSLAVIARAHGVRFMVAAPLSTIDLETPDGASIPIEERTGEELLSFREHRIAPAGITAHNPVFDVTQASLIDVLVTEKGLIERPDKESIARLFRAGN
jgi:methylthioribose-1-phosphate isomerase